MPGLTPITIPPMCEELAEFLGICYGDGHLSVQEKRHTYRLEIVGHAQDDDAYLKQHVAGLIRRLFHIEARFMHSRAGNWITLYCHSKNLVFFLKELGMPAGKKRALQIPREIAANRELMIAFIRGVFDTDGTFNLKRRYRTVPYYPTIAISSICQPFLYSIWEFLRSNGFEMGKMLTVHVNLERYGYGSDYTQYRFFLYGKVMALRWFSLIGPHNPKALSRFASWPQESCR